MELRRRLIYALATTLALPSALPGQGNNGNTALVLNAAAGTPGAAGQESRTCVLPFTMIPLAPAFPTCPETVTPYFFVQGRRFEFRVYNRKFFTDYSLTVDAVTSLTPTPMIRGLDEAATLAITPPNLATPPVSKGPISSLTVRTTRTILAELLDETTAVNVRTELLADRQEIDRERAKIAVDFAAFDQTYNQLAGIGVAPVNCATLAGAPNFAAASYCLKTELATESTGAWAVPPFDGEQEFREVNTRVGDLVSAMANLSTILQTVDFMTPSQTITGETQQFEINLNTYQGNYRATRDAITIAHLLLTAPETNLRLTLRQEQMRALLSAQLKSDKSVDDVILNQLLGEYLQLIGTPLRRAQFTALLNNLEADISPLNPAGIAAPNEQLNIMRRKVNVLLPATIDQVNALQSQLLNRVNYIYDHSQVKEALIHTIDLSAYSGNLIVYFTVRRIETFTRYTIAPISLPSQSQTAQTPPLPATTPLPPAPATPTAAAPAPAAPAATTAATTPSAPAPPPGIVVANGNFQVHELDRGTVVAAVAVSTLKDQNVGQMTPSVISPTTCPNATAPTAPATTYTDPNCFAPTNNGTSRQVHGIAGVAFYFRRRDTFPGSLTPPAVHREPGQYFGFMGALAVDQLNSYFLGPFWEPFVGLQVSGGVNFGNETVLNPNYKFGTPVDLTGSFTTSKQKIGAFVAIGLDLGIFKKVFGQVTGIGQQVGTVGAPPTAAPTTP